MTMEYMHVPRANRDAVMLSVIAPCFNEEDNIDPLVERTLAVFDAISATG